MALRGIWATLGIEPTNDATEIKRAYARRLKQVHPEDDPEGFQALRAAYDSATDMAGRGYAAPAPRTRPKTQKQPVTPDGDVLPPETADDVGGWNDGADDRWGEAYDEDDDGGWFDGPGDRWDARGHDTGAGDWIGGQPRDWHAAPAPEPELPEELRAELAAERARQEAHARLCDELAAAVNQSTLPAEDLLSLMIRVLRSPGMDSLQVHARTEYWLAGLIARGGPGADGLVEAAIRFFGWDSARVGVDISHAWPVLQRRETVILLDRLRRPETRGHRAWVALRAKQTWFQRIRDRLDTSLGKEVPELLDRMEHDLPELEAHLEPAALTAWRARLERVRFGPGFLLALIFGPPILAFFPLASETFGPPSLMIYLALWVVALGGMTGLGALYLHGVVQPSIRWRRGNPWGKPLAQRFGWSAAALGLLTITGLLPHDAWTAWPALIAGAAVVGWTRVATSHLHAQPRTRWRIPELIGVIPILVYLAFQTTETFPPAVLPALATVVAAFYVGRHAISEEWAHTPAKERRQASLILLGATAAVGALAIVASKLSLAPLACGLVCALVMADRAIGWDRFEPLLETRRWWMGTGWLAGLILAVLPFWTDFQQGVTAGLALWLAGGAVLTALAGVFPAESGSRQGRKGKRKGAGHFA